VAVKACGLPPADNFFREVRMERYRCMICDYVYDPRQGDPDNGVAPGTAFEDLPDGWTCPLCGADQGNFEKI
jgi:rubredoxin